MTLNEFNDEVISIEDLREFCYDEGFEEYIEDFFDGDYLDQDLTYRIPDMIAQERWTNVRDFLNDIPEDCDYYQYHNGDIVEFDDDDGQRVINDLRQHLIEIDWFDEEPHFTYSPDPDEAEEFDDELLSEDISINDLLFSPMAS